MSNFITLTSDFGRSSHYLAILKSGILSQSNNINIIDICHDIKHFDIEEGAYLLKNTYKHFPKGSIHIFTIENDRNKYFPIIAELDGHYFIGSDNGFIGLLDSNKITNVIKLNNKINKEGHFLSDIIGETAGKIAKGVDILTLGNKLTNYNILLNNSIRKAKDNIVGKILYIDNYGNLISNIDKNIFENWIDNGNYKINVGYETLSNIHNSCSNVKPGESFCIFNSSDLLEIGIYYGNASQLLGMDCNSPIVIRKSINN